MHSDFNFREKVFSEWIVDLIHATITIIIIMIIIIIITS